MASYLTETGLNTLVTKIKGLFASHTTNTSNPHEVTKTQLGLGSVENKSSETIRNEITSENIISALGYTPSSETDNSDTKNTTGSTDTANKIYLDRKSFNPTMSLASWQFTRCFNTRRKSCDILA